MSTSVVMDDEDDPEYLASIRFEVFDERRGNSLHWCPSVDEAKRWAESHGFAREGTVITETISFDVVYRYHGPLVTP